MNSVSTYNNCSSFIGYFKTEWSFDPEKPMITSGIRLGSPAGTTRGLGLEEFEKVGNIIGDVLDGLASNKSDNSVAERQARNQIVEICKRFPIYW